MSAPRNSTLMTVQHEIAGTDHPIADLPGLRILEGLARIHRWILVIDEQRRVAWKSDALAEIAGLDELAPGTDARSFLAKLPRPEQIFALRSSMRDRGHLERAPLELRSADGRAPRPCR